MKVDVASKTTGAGGGRRDADRMGRGKKEKDGRHETPLYSREDIREQYCINSRDVEGHERASRRSKGFFGCLTSRKVGHLRIYSTVQVGPHQNSSL